VTLIARRPTQGSRLDEFERRLRALEAKVARLAGGVVTPGGAVYDANVLVNPDAEAGSGNWGLSWFTGSAGTYSIEIAAPIAGVRSFRVDSPAGSWQRIWSTPAFAVAPGQTWRLEASLRALCSGSAWPSTGAFADLILSTGLNASGAGSPYVIFDADASWVQADQLANAPHDSTIPLAGEVVVPSGRAFACVILDLAFTAGSEPTSAYAYLADTVSARRRLS
jgi:hypothetical protein